MIILNSATRLDSMMGRYLLAITFLLCCTASTGKDCKEKDILKNLYATKTGYKQKIDSLSDSRKTPRSVFLALKDCTVYYGNIDIQENSADDLGFDEYVRQEDFANLKNIRVVYGFINLNLKRYPGIKSLSFLSSLRMIQTTVKKRGLILFHSELEVIGFSNVRLNVPYVGIGYNRYLCYMDNFRTINSSIEFNIIDNKATDLCQIEGKVCSKACLPDTGCWGPRDDQCFHCQWKAGSDCVSSCDSRRDFFKPLSGRICGRCHRTCWYGCAGPERSQCFPHGGPKEYCQKHMFFDYASKRCRECSKSCFGDSFDKRNQLTVRACSGPESSAGPRGCSVKCEGTTFLTISSYGQLQCSPCHENCLSCQNGSPSGCLQVRESKKESQALQGNSDNQWWIVWIVLCLVMIGLGLGLTFGILAIRKKLKNRRKKRFIKRHMTSGRGDFSQFLSMMKSMVGSQSSGGSDDDSDDDDEENPQPATSAQSPGATSDQPSNGILISFQQEDAEIVKKIHKHLEDKGFRCEMKEPNRRAEDAEMMSCKVILACITDGFTASEDRRQELNRVNERRNDSKVPVIITLVLNETAWPPCGEDIPLMKIQSLEGEIKMSTKEADDWSGDNVGTLMKQLKTHLGVNLIVLYDKDFHSLVTSRQELQGKKVRLLSNKYSEMKCYIPSLSPGWCSFKDLRTALKPLFTGPKITGMDQVRGIVNKMNVAMATSSKNDKLATNITDNPYCTIDGEEFKYREAKRPMKPQKFRSGGRAFLCGGGRRTALRIKML